MVLTIGIGRDNARALGKVHQDIVHASLQRRAFSQVDRMVHHVYVFGVLNLLERSPRFQRASVVHHDDRLYSQFQQRIHQGHQGSAGLIRRNQNRHVRKSLFGCAHQEVPFVAVTTSLAR